MFGYIYKKDVAIIAVVLCLCLGKYTADGGSWDDVKTAFVEGWATQYNNEIANG